MDFGVVGLDGLVGSENGFASLASESEIRQKGYGSGFGKQERSGTVEDDWRSLKMPRTDDFSASKSMLPYQRAPSLLRSNSLFLDGQQHQQMLSFSSPKSEALLLSNDGALVERSLQNGTLPYYLHTSSTYSRNAGLGSGSLNAASIHGILTGVRGPFTPSQWMELEHQALIYKYITANVPIPSNLLIPIRKTLGPYGFSGLSAGSLRPNTLGWGSFHLGFSGNTDPEPGRCRRTDGKKWRCSRDAVAEQKYCERHMNRGRHRSRKPVEGQNGHTGPATTKVMHMASSSSASVVSGVTQHQIKSLHPGVANASPTSHFNRMGHGTQDSQDLSMPSPMNLKSRDAPFSVSKQQISLEEYPRGLTSDSLNPSRRISYMNCTNFALHDLNNREPEPLHHFIDDWPKNRSNGSASTWPKVEIHSDRTQLSISIPMGSSDFSSHSSSPNQDKLTLSPLRLCKDFDPVQMGLGVGSILNEPTQRQTNWVPISWETSVGGPLGEVLNNPSNISRDSKSSSALNLLTEGWDASPRLGSSPTGVLQKAAVGSYSNSSSGSSPRAENTKNHEGVSLCDGLHGSTFVNSSSIRSL